ncbi:MAG TPA: acylphosphatase [Patescibacteria group bacterium]
MNHSVFMKVVHLLIHGYVQGVGYRKFVRHLATKFGLVGWVRNLPEGTVEAEVGGEKDHINDLIQICKKGPMLSDVTKVDVEWSEKDFEYTDFVIRHEV